MQKELEEVKTMLAKVITEKAYGSPYPIERKNHIINQLSVASRCVDDCLNQVRIINEKTAEAEKAKAEKAKTEEAAKLKLEASTAPVAEAKKEG